MTATMPISIADMMSTFGEHVMSRAIRMAKMFDERGIPTSLLDKEIAFITAGGYVMNMTDADRQVLSQQRGDFGDRLCEFGVQDEYLPATAGLLQLAYHICFGDNPPMPSRQAPPPIDEFGPTVTDAVNWISTKITTDDPDETAKIFILLAATRWMDKLSPSDVRRVCQVDGSDYIDYISHDMRVGADADPIKVQRQKLITGLITLAFAHRTA